MAVKGANIAGNRLSRAGAYLNTAASFTILCWTQRPTALANGNGATSRLYGDPTYADPYIWLGTLATAGVQNAYLEIYDGATYVESVNIPVAVTTWYGFAIVVDKPGGVVRLYRVLTPGGSAVLVDTLAVDVSAITFVATTENAYGDPSGDARSAVCYDRVFASALTAGQIAAEFNSPVAILTALADTPLPSPGVLTDLSGNARGWTAVGTPAYLTGPLTPTNITAAAATVISSLPYSATEYVTDAPENPPGFFHSVWFKWTAPSGVRFVYLAGHQSEAAAFEWDPDTIVWTGPDVDSLSILEASDGEEYNRDLGNPIDHTKTQYFRLVVTPGQTYWFQMANGEPGGIARLKVDLFLPPSVEAPVGSFVVQDDTDGYPAAVFDPDGTFYAFPPFPAGEFANTMPNGSLLAQDGEADTGVALFDASWRRGVTRDWAAEGLVDGIWSDRTRYYAVLVSGAGTSGTHTIYILDRATLATVATILPTQGFGLQSILDGALSQDGTRFYAARRNPSTSQRFIDVYDVEAGTRLTTWTIDAGGGAPWDGKKDGFSLADGTFVLARSFAGSVGQNTIVRYSDVDGSVVQVYDGAQGNVSRLNRLCYIDETTFGLWGQGADSSEAFFQVVSLSTGLVISETPAMPITGGSIQSQQNAANSISNSCPVFVLSHALLFSDTEPPEPPVTDDDGDTLPHCATTTPQRLVIRGTGFPDDPVVTLTDPNGDRFTPTIVSSSATQIVVLAIILVCGEWTVSISGGPAQPFTPLECECCMATKLSIINQALQKIGVSQTLTTLADPTREAYTGGQLFDPALREALRAFPWAFATKYAAATDADEGEAMELLDGAAGSPVNRDWIYAYRYPDDCVFARRVVPASGGRTYSDAPIPFRPGAITIDGEHVLVIFTDEADAVLEYTQYVACAENFADALYEDAVSWLVALKMAPSLSRLPDIMKTCAAGFQIALDRATSVSAREQQQHKPGDAEWITGR